MYHKLKEQLEISDDISLKYVIDKISVNNFDADVLHFITSSPDFISSYEKIITFSQITNNLRTPVSMILILNNLNKIPSLKTSRYL